MGERVLSGKAPPLLSANTRRSRDNQNRSEAAPRYDHAFLDDIQNAEDAALRIDYRQVRYVQVLATQDSSTPSTHGA